MNAILRQAQWFAERGYSVIPIDHPGETAQTDSTKVGKVPIGRWKQFQTALPTADDLETWFGNGHQRNIGVVTGALR